VLATEEEQRWNKGKGVREVRLVETCEGVQVQPAGTISNNFFEFFFLYSVKQYIISILY